MDLQKHLQARAANHLKTMGLLWLGFYEIQGDEARRLAYDGPVPPCDRFSLGKGNVGWAAQYGVKKVVDDVTQDAQYSQCFLETASEVVLPIKFDEKILGVLDAESDIKGFFKQNARVTELEDLAAQIACILHSKHREKTLAIDRLVEEIAGLSPEKYHWTGVYLLKESGLLHLEAFRGEATPHMVIPTDRGICGAAVREGRTMNVADVSQDSRYLSCSIKTKSEIVLPIRKDGRIVGEIDIDSHVLNAFTGEDEEILEKYCHRVAGFCS